MCLAFKVLPETLLPRLI